MVPLHACGHRNRVRESAELPKQNTAMVCDMIEGMTLQWQELSHKGGLINSIFRAKVPGGWLVQVYQPDGCGITFYPDPEHEWDGGSLP